MWNRQAALLAGLGFFVVAVDTRGHGESTAPPAPYAMEDLVADTVALLDELGIERAHYVGLSLGGMSGFGLGLRHAERLLSLVLCSARADAPPTVAAPWDDRIDTARALGCGALATATLDRWFRPAFLGAHAAVRDCFTQVIAATSVAGFEGCARAIQALAYKPRVGAISVPTTLLVGAEDGVMPAVNAELQELISGARLETISGAGHLPNIDQADLFDAALLRHFDGLLPRQRPTHRERNEAP